MSSKDVVKAIYDEKFGDIKPELNKMMADRIGERLDEFRIQVAKGLFKNEQEAK